MDGPRGRAPRIQIVPTPGGGNSSHFISGVDPNMRAARCSRMRDISFVQRKWKFFLKKSTFNEYIQQTV